MLWPPIFRYPGCIWLKSIAFHRAKDKAPYGRNERQIIIFGRLPKKKIMKGEVKWTILFSASLTFAIAFSVAAIVMQNDTGDKASA
jgi:hypothetical protein